MQFGKLFMPRVSKLSLDLINSIVIEVERIVHWCVRKRKQLAESTLLPLSQRTEKAVLTLTPDPVHPKCPVISPDTADCGGNNLFANVLQFTKHKNGNSNSYIDS